MPELTSRERLVRTIRHDVADYIPCSFMLFRALALQIGSTEDSYNVVKAARAMGLDPFLFIPSASRAERPEHPDLRGLPVRFNASVTSREWRVETPGGYPLLHKEYGTPAGRLHTTVQLTEDWPHGDHIPFVDDFQISRTLKPLITEPAEIEAVPYLLTPPSKEDIAQFRQEADKARAFAAEQGVLLCGGWGVGADMANWLCGFENLMMLEHDHPDFVVALLRLIHAWNLERMKVVLSAPVDLCIRRAWYENCGFLTPRFYRETILPQLKTEVELAHEAGALFGYICTSGLGPLLDSFLEAGIDVLIGLDPVQGTYTDLAAVKQKIGDRICLWGGVSGATTVEMGEETEVRAAVTSAIEMLGPRGFILSPVDNVRIDTPKTWRNVQAFLDEWRLRRSL